ncbi:MAG: hypothetical protein JW745_08925 [Sedimentisphaerales bacterium]|nr:hypothetical protein [Sedimentisphaerales bacterium]MBN2841775.1 hypothetical protein [Sedimentisphaerales bacterium]
MIATMLTVIVVLLAAFAVNNIYRSKTAVLAVNDTTGGAFFVIDSINNDLANMLLPWQHPETVIDVIPGGSEQDPADRLIIYRQTDPDMAMTHTAQVEYGLLKTDSTEGICRLARRFARLAVNQTVNNRGKVFILADQVRSLRFELFDGISWRRGGVPKGTVVTEVRISMELAGSVWGRDSSVISCRLPVGWFTQSRLKDKEPQITSEN